MAAAGDARQKGRHGANQRGQQHRAERDVSLPRPGGGDALSNPAWQRPCPTYNVTVNEVGTHWHHCQRRLLLSQRATTGNQLARVQQRQRAARCPLPEPVLTVSASTELLPFDDMDLVPYDRHGAVAGAGT